MIMGKCKRHTCVSLPPLKHKWSGAVLENQLLNLLLGGGTQTLLRTSHVFSATCVAANEVRFPPPLHNPEGSDGGI